MSSAWLEFDPETHAARSRAREVMFYSDVSLIQIRQIGITVNVRGIILAQESLSGTKQYNYWMGLDPQSG